MLMEIVSSLEQSSTHPIALSFINYAKDNNLKTKKIDKFKNLAGIGITGTLNEKEYAIGNEKIFNQLKIENKYQKEAQKLSEEGNSIVYIIEDKKMIGLIGVKDIVRNNTKEVIQKLKRMKKEIIMLTGDNETTATIIAKSIGIDTIIANVSPKEKSIKIKNLIQEGKKVMMVGDGINDAPSLSVSDIGVSLNSGTDIASNSSDVILMKDNLNSIYNLFDISKNTLRNIKQNLFWAFFYNICMIPIAMGILEGIGLVMNPMIAGLAMTISSTTVIVNALRLKKWREK